MQLNKLQEERKSMAQKVTDVSDIIDRRLRSYQEVPQMMYDSYFHANKRHKRADAKVQAFTKLWLKVMSKNRNK